MVQCRYRKQTHECDKYDGYVESASGINTTCMVCIHGQQVDSIELQTSAISNLTASIEEILSERLLAMCESCEDTPRISLR